MSLPHLDTHRRIADAAIDDTFEAAWDQVRSMCTGPVAKAYGTLVRCEPRTVEAVDGEPEPGRSSIIAFQVTEARRPRLLVLEGRHHFARYRVSVELAPTVDDTTEVTLTTHASFPGVTGRAYRVLVMRTGAHVLASRALLGAIVRRAERAERAP